MLHFPGGENAGSMAASLRRFDKPREYAKQTEGSDKLDDVQDYGGRARTTLESIDRSGLDSSIRHKIEEAIRHAINAHNASSPDGGQHDARRVRELIDEILGEPPS
jgi:hypothetical protein